MRSDHIDADDVNPGTLFAIEENSCPARSAWFCIEQFQQARNTDISVLIGLMLFLMTGFHLRWLPCSGDPLRRADEASSAEPSAAAQPDSRSAADAAASTDGQQHAAAAKPLNSPDSHVELMGAVPTDVEDSGSERFSLELPRSPQHGGVLSPALLSPSGRGGPGDSSRPHPHHSQQQQHQRQSHATGGAFPLPSPGGAAGDSTLDEGLYSVARGTAAAVGVGYSPRGPARTHHTAQQQPNTGDLAGSPRSDAGSESAGGRPPSGQHHSQQPQQQRQQRPRDLPLAIPRLSLGASLGDG